jgi:hypothetical protein
MSMSKSRFWYSKTVMFQSMLFHWSTTLILHKMFLSQMVFETKTWHQKLVFWLKLKNLNSVLQSIFCIIYVNLCVSLNPEDLEQYCTKFCKNVLKDRVKHFVGTEFIKLLNLL